MPHFVINGPQKLSGELQVAGSKNAALKAIAASLLSDQPMTIRNLPDIEDVHSMLRILSALGAEVQHIDHTAVISTRNVRSGDLASIPDAARVRTTVVLIGPLLARFGEVRMGYPGGDKIGRRPIDLFLQGFRALGAEVREEADVFTFRSTGLRGGYFFFPFVSVSATEALMLAAVTILGETVLENAAMEPEIPALAEYLNAHGARISGAGTSRIVIRGNASHTAGEMALIPDRVEAGTWVILGLATRSPLRVVGVAPEHLKSLFALLDAIGAPYRIAGNTVETLPYEHPLRPIHVRTHEYPGFMTDLQAPFVVLLTQAHGMSLVHETIFEGRLFYTDLLNRMGANIILCDPHRAMVEGPTSLRGRRLESPDIRAGMAMVIAGLLAKGETIIDNIYQIERGYERVHERLGAVGAKIERRD